MRPRPLEPMPNWRREEIYWKQNGRQGDPSSLFRMTDRQRKRIRLHDNRARKPVARKFLGLKR